MAANNSNWPALYKNLRKAQGKWALISCPLLKTGVSPRYVGYFYKAIVQTVLLYGSETWTVTPQMIETLNGFHHKIARRISNMMPVREQNDTWYYPPIGLALEKAGLFTVAEYIANQPIMKLCTQQAADFGNSRMYCWWTQPLRVNSTLNTKEPIDGTHIARRQGPRLWTSGDEAETTSLGPDNPEMVLHRLHVQHNVLPLLDIPAVNAPPPPLPPLTIPTTSTAMSTISSLSTSHSQAIRPLLTQERIILETLFKQSPSSTRRVSAQNAASVSI
jgi:hypothetical protein